MITTPTTTALENIKPQSMVRIEEHVAHLLPQEDIRARFAAVMMQQIRVSPALQKCTPESVIAAVVRMAQLQLDPAIPNECWLVPFKSEATFIIGYGGLRKLALRSPEVRDILVAAVHEHDVYASPASPIALPTHSRAGSFQPRGRVIGYYAAALLSAGHWRVIEMSRAEVRTHRDRYSRSAQSTFWSEGKPDEEGLSNFDKMALKTVLRQLCSPRNLSLSAAVETALVHEETLYDPRYRQIEEPQRATVQGGNGHQAANDLFGGEQGLIGVAQQNDDKEYESRLLAETEERHTHTSAIGEKHKQIDALIVQINTIWEEKGYPPSHIDRWWNTTCENSGVDEPEQLSLQTLGFCRDGAQRAAVSILEEMFPSDDIPEKLHGGKLWLDQIEAVWRAGGLNADQIAGYWVKTCKRFQVDTREQLKASILPQLKKEAQDWTQKNTAPPEPEPALEPEPVSTMGSAWRIDLPIACRGVQDKETLDAVWEATLDPTTPDTVGLALLERVRIVGAEAGTVAESV